MDELPAAIVTGGVQGIGAAISKLLLNNGYRVCVADVQDEKGKEFVKELQQKHGQQKIIYSHCNVTEEEEIDATFRQTLKAFKRIDVLCNNAGKANEDYPKTTVSINLMGVINGCEMAFRYMGKSNKGKGGMVINTASQAGIMPFPVSPVYSATKHAVVGLTRSFGHPLHFEKEGIIFAAVCPGFTDTDIIKSVRLKYNFGAKRGTLLSADYVAKGVLKILEDRINGSTLLITHKVGYKYIELPEEYFYSEDNI